MPQLNWAYVKSWAEDNNVPDDAIMATFDAEALIDLNVSEEDDGKTYFTFEVGDDDG